MVYTSVDAVLRSGCTVNGIVKPRIPPARRYDGMKVWLQELEQDWAFIGGVDDSNFQRVPGGGGGGELTKDVIATLTVGGIIPGSTQGEGTTLQNLWELLVAPAQAPGVSAFTAAPAFGLKEIGVPIGAVNLNAVVTRGTADIVSATIERVSPPDVIATNTAVAMGGVVSGVDSTGIDNGTRVYRLTVVDVAERTTVREGTFEFVYPALIGSVPTTTPIEEQIQEMAGRQIVKRSTRTQPITHTASRICGAFPSTWGEVTRILDGNQFNVTGGFVKTSMMLNFGPYSTEYNVYVATTATTFTDFIMTFVFE